MKRTPNNLEYMFLIAILVCPSVVIAGWFLVTEAEAGNTIALAILITCGVMAVGLFANISTILAIFANQRQDNEVIQNSREIQQDALAAARLLAQIQKIQQTGARNAPPSFIAEPEPRYLDAGTSVIEGLE